MSGLMAGGTKDSGPTTKWKVKAFSLGLMVVGTRVSTLTTKSKAMVFSSGNYLVFYCY